MLYSFSGTKRRLYLHELNSERDGDNEDAQKSRNDNMRIDDQTEADKDEHSVEFVDVGCIENANEPLTEYYSEV